MQMKKVLAVLVALLLVLSLSACSQKNNDTNDSSLDTAEIKDTGKKIEGRITNAADFSEGLAFVKLEGDDNTTYCINKKGNIVFQINENTNLPSFKNGHAIINGGICDTTGKIINPEDIGVTTFYDYAFEGGYILAEKVTADYSSSKKELGIMDFSFKWIVDPSEKLHTILDAGWLYYLNGCVVSSDKKICINLKTGELAQANDELFADYPNFWLAENSGENLVQNTCLYFSDLFNKQRLQIKDKNLNMPNAYLRFRFTNNHCVIGFYNKEVDKSYLTLIDKTGKYLFDPVEFNDRGIGRCYFDGEYILATDYGSNYEGINDRLTKMKTYDIKGNMLGEMTVDKNGSYDCSFNDGVILVSHGLTGSKTYDYYTPDFQPLF